MNPNTFPSILEPLKFIILNENGEPSHLHLFNTNKTSVNYQDTDIFTEDEQIYLEKYNTPLSISSQKILQDDSIRSIKIKLLQETNFKQFSYEELYMFSRTSHKINFQKHFDLLSKDNFGISKQQIGQLIVNLQLHDKSENIIHLAQMDTNEYSYKDIENELHLHNNYFDIYTPIGHKFDSYLDIMFSANPYFIVNAKEYNLENNPENRFLTFENSLLLNYKKIHNNTIFVSIANNVLQYTNSINLDQNKIIKTYFPFLYNKNIFTLSTLNDQKEQLLNDSQKAFQNITFNKINTFYDIFNENVNIPYISQGITDVYLTLHPEIKTILPLENIFKQLHTSKNTPLIKYKPGFKKEELFRIFSVGFSTNGKKIPYLTKPQIMNYPKKNIGSYKYLSIMVQKTFENQLLPMYFTVSHNGSIHIDTKFSKPVSKSFIESFIIDSLNPIIIEINKFLQDNNKLSLLENLDTELLEINKINHISLITSSSPFKSTDLKLLNPLFNIIELKNNNASLRYKKVDNYTEMNEMEAQINHLYKQNTNLATIINLISINFSLSDEEANLYVTKYMNECTRTNGNFVNKNITIADNPGFNTLIKYNDIENIFEIEFFDITDFSYLPLLQLYIDSFLKLSLFKNKLQLGNNYIEQLKTTVKKKEQDEKVDNVIITEVDDATNVQLKSLDIVKELAQQENITEDDDNNYIFFGNDEADEDDDTSITEDEIEEENFEEEAKIVLSDDDDEDDDDIDLFKGGIKTDKNNGTIFFNKLKKLEPTIFIDESNGAYANICPSQSNRQPVILTQEEKDAIDNDPEAKNAYGMSLRYGSDPNNKFWYMCPRYWCLKTNKPMTQEQVDNGECGGKIIPQKDKTKIPEGYYIYEFTDDRQHIDRDGNYTTYSPGFLDESKSASRHGIPCCFKNPFGAKQTARRQELGVSDEDIDFGNKSLIQGEQVEKVKITRNYNNILSIERIPIPQHRWGFLPISIELFLQTNISEFLDTANNTYIKKNAAPLLRYGVEKSPKQSFLSCIADIYTFEKNINVPTVKQIKQIIIQKLSIDNFLKLQNGSLLPLFQPTKINISDIQVEKYKNTEYYKSIDLNNNAQYNMLKYTISSFENFVNYLEDDDSIIDHVFMWDIVSSPTIELFPNGVNLVIMEVKDYDKRDNVQLLCPTNYYSESYFDDKKGTILLLKQGPFYEPIYVYGNTRNEKSSNKLNAIKIFYTQNTPTNLNPVFNNIQQTLNTYCKPKPKDKIYKYKENINVKILYTILHTHNFIIHAQVLNYRGKVIALMVSDETENNIVYIPCKPSAQLENISTTFLDDVEWLDYSNTFEMLHAISSKTNQQVLCKPIVKLEEDGLIVGFITETNQFIEISEPQQNLSEDGLQTIQSRGYSNYYDAEKTITTSNDSDNVRNQTVQNIKLETKFYLQFRHALKDEIMNLMNKEESLQLQKLATTQSFVYEMKLEKVRDLLKTLLENSVRFVEFENNTLDFLYKKNNMDPHNEHGLCLHAENQLCIPQYNLITNEDNEYIYYYRLADEIVRNSRIRSYLFNPYYMKLTNVDYSVNNNEMLLLNSNLTDEFFKNINTESNNNYIENIPYEIAVPNKKQKKNNVITLTQQITKETFLNYTNLESECIQEQDKNTISLKNSPLCSHFVLLYILKQTKNIEEDISSIKKTLLVAYNKLIQDNIFYGPVYTILSKQLKKEYIAKINKKQLSFESMIMNENYMITHLDIWVFCDYMNLPVVLHSKEPFKQMQLDDKYIICGGDYKKDNYIFIHTIPIKTTTKYFPGYTIDTTIQPLQQNKTIFKQSDNINYTPILNYLSKYKVALKIKK
jgi:hypothetical protein